MTRRGPQSVKTTLGMWVEVKNCFARELKILIKVSRG
jgi:hypothetical protein